MQTQTTKKKKKKRYSNMILKLFLQPTQITNPET